jgi:hypothetical protein
MRLSGNVPSHPASAAIQTAKPSEARAQTDHRPWSLQEVPSVRATSRAERATSHASQACVAAKNGRVEARIGIARQCTAQIAGRAPNQTELRPWPEVADASPTPFQIVLDSTSPTCKRVIQMRPDPYDLIMPKR